MSLRALGWDDEWQRVFEQEPAAGTIPARVLAEHRGMYRIGTGSQNELPAELAGKLRHEAIRRSELPAVGDFVRVRTDSQGGPAIVASVLPRRTAFIRKAAGKSHDDQVVGANLNTVLIVSALDGDFNLRRLERYLTLAWESGAAPVIVLNKADLSHEAAERMAETEAIAYAVPIHITSALEHDGLEVLDQYLQPGQTLGVIGSSGVGKSTLINRLLGQDVQVTKDVRSGDSRGRHTTTHRQLFERPGGGIVLDTPGMRELQMWSADEGLGAAFPEIAALAEQCRFRDCQHTSEPGCAVRAAIERGELDPERLTSHAKLLRELQYANARTDRNAMLERKREERIANKAMKPFKQR